MNSRIKPLAFLMIALVVAVIEAYQWHLSGYGQLWFWRAYIPVAIFATYLLATATDVKWLRVIGVIVGVITFRSIAFLDHQLAKAEFKDLCVKEAGIRIYETVSLPSEKFDSVTGRPIFLDLPKLSLTDKQLAEIGYNLKMNGEARVKGKWGIYRLMSIRYVRRIDQAVVGESRELLWEGGGPPRLVPHQMRCENIASKNVVDELTMQVFVKADSLSRSINH